MAQFGKSATDTGSAEGQIALFTYRIKHLTEQTKESNVKGWKVKHSDVEEYIKESKMSKEDWKNYAKELEKKLAALQQDASQAPEQAENNGEKPEVLTQGEEQKEPKMPPSDALEFELNAMIARLQNENEDFTEIPSETITEVKEQILKDVASDERLQGNTQHFQKERSSIRTSRKRIRNKH